MEEVAKADIMENATRNIDSINLKETPEYELKLVDRKQETTDDQIIKKVEDNAEITYKYYDIALESEKIESVNTIEEAETLVNEMKDTAGEELKLSIVEKHTQDETQIETKQVEEAKTGIEEKIQVAKVELAEKARIAALPSVNGIKLAVKPVSGIITSRYGAVSSIRSSSHTGLDIATSSGTPIKVVADGTVISAQYSGSYGNIVKISHGNGVETWYAHTKAMYVKAGQTVKAGDVIAAVGTTGNSTGPHLHFEVRINGSSVNPQRYLYN